MTQLLDPYCWTLRRPTLDHYYWKLPLTLQHEEESLDDFLGGNESESHSGLELESEESTETEDNGIEIMPLEEPE